MLPISLQKAIEAQFHILSVEGCGGGDINQAARLNTPDGPFFIKWHPNSPTGMFSAEAKGLALLAQANTLLRIPQVMSVQEQTNDTPAYLILEWFNEGRSHRYAEQLGYGLANLHQQTVSQHGLDHNNYIGSLPQSNQFTAAWVDFYANQRIKPQMEIARRSGELPPHREKLLETLLSRLSEFLPHDNPPASLLHGDLWRGNVMSIVNGPPAIIDPAVYYGHREIEIAFTELFGGLGTRFYETYNEVYPLPPDYVERRSLYQLYPLMVHMNIFRGAYGNRVDAILRHYVG